MHVYAGYDMCTLSYPYLGMILTVELFDKTRMVRVDTLQK